MKMKNLLGAAVVSTALTLGSIVWAGEHMREVVDQKSLPEAVQKTITEQAKGGKIVSIHREDDKDGKWNYEVAVVTEGKEWGFEVDPNGKFVKKHDDHKKTQ